MAKQSSRPTCYHLTREHCQALCRPLCERFYGGVVPKIEFGIPFPQIVDSERIVRTVPDHEVLLRFVNDGDAERFADWLQEDRTWQAFCQYAEAARD